SKSEEICSGWLGRPSTAVSTRSSGSPRPQPERFGACSVAESPLFLRARRRPRTAPRNALGAHGIAGAPPSRRIRQSFVALNLAKQPRRPDSRGRAQRPRSKLGGVASDIFGTSGRTMLKALIPGERDAEKLADLACGLLRKKEVMSRTGVG